MASTPVAAEVSPRQVPPLEEEEALEQPNKAELMEEGPAAAAEKPSAPKVLAAPMDGGSQAPAAPNTPAQQPKLALAAAPDAELHRTAEAVAGVAAPSERIPRAAAEGEGASASAAASASGSGSASTRASSVDSSSSAALEQKGDAVAAAPSSWSAAAGMAAELALTACAALPLAVAMLLALPFLVLCPAVVGLLHAATYTLQNAAVWAGQLRAAGGRAATSIGSLSRRPRQLAATGAGSRKAGHAVRALVSRLAPGLLLSAALLAVALPLLGALVHSRGPIVLNIPIPAFLLVLSASSPEAAAAAAAAGHPAATAAGATAAHPVRDALSGQQGRASPSPGPASAGQTTAGSTGSGGQAPPLGTDAASEPEPQPVPQPTASKLPGQASLERLAMMRSSGAAGAPPGSVAAGAAVPAGADMSEMYRESSAKNRAVTDRNPSAGPHINGRHTHATGLRKIGHALRAAAQSVRHGLSAVRQRGAASWRWSIAEINQIKPQPGMLIFGASLPFLVVAARRYRMV